MLDGSGRKKPELFLLRNKIGYPKRKLAKLYVVEVGDSL